ncbi:hypothetical protein [Streptomyces sp. NRRL S-244]|uniref:hypothetical protein n=1 Tax=Streptomyces sp. NRRL S-244 TaxID=1463897 RepID=UPI00068A0AA2|nr:hypothetical protein [Streptomyces sp. NRRL S-244]
MEHEQTLPAQPEGEETAARRPRAGRRTVFLIAGAVVLGTLAGTVTGYAIQYDREPTPLPPLAQQTIDQPKPQAPNGSTSTRTINAGRWHATDDALTKLLVEAPSGAEVRYSGTLSPDEFSADYYKKPGGGLSGQIGHSVRRIAAREWAQDDRNFVKIRLFQYRDRSGADWYQHAHSYMNEKEYAGNPGKDLPGVPADFGHLWVDSAQRETAGYLPTKSARVIARRGDVVMELEYMNNRGVVDENEVVEIAKRQWERL